MNPSRDRDPQALRSDIHVTRARLDDTMDELGERMQPRHLLDEVLGIFRRSSEDSDGSLHRAREKITQSADAAMHAVVDAVKQNPMPALLIGAGVAWMIYEGRREQTTDMRDEPELDPRDRDGIRYDPDLHYDRPLQERAGEKLHAARERAGELTAKVGERARVAYGKTRDRVVTTADEHPLETALVCLAAGVIAGLALPTPAAAHRVAGPTADRLRDRARETGTEMLEKTKRVARAAATAAKAEAQTQGLAPARPPAGTPDQSDGGNPSGSAAGPFEPRPEISGM